MEPVSLIAGGIAAVAPVIADLIGRALGAGDRAEADRLMEQALAQFGPDILKAPSIAELTPQLGRPAMADVQADPQAVAAQREALAEMKRASSPDNLEFRAATNEAEDFANQQAGAQQAAIQQQMQARGLGGSGVDFALRQQAGSDAANRSAAHGFSAAVEGRRQALDALKNYGSMAGTIRGQSFGEGAQKARAIDRVAELNEAGKVAGQKAAFDAQMGLSTTRANVLGNAANVKSGQAAQTQQQWGNYGAGVGQGAGVSAQAWDEEKRKQAGGG